MHLQYQNDKAFQFISQKAGRPSSADICIYTLYSRMVFQRRECTIKINQYKGLICRNCIYDLRKWHSWHEVLDSVAESPQGPPKVEQSPHPSPAIPSTLLPHGADTPELALTCGRQGAPSGSERRAYAMPATSSAQPCMKYEIKKTHNFIPSYVRSHIHIVSYHHQLTP